MIHHTDIEELVTESQRLRDELMKTAAKLESFSEQLQAEVARIEEAVSDGDGQGHNGTDTSGT